MISRFKVSFFFFLSKAAVKHQGEWGARKIHSSSPSPVNRSFQNICSFKNIRNFSDFYIEAKFISATLLRVEQFAEKVSLSNVKFRDIFHSIIQFESVYKGVRRVIFAPVFWYESIFLPYFFFKSDLKFSNRLVLYYFKCTMFA